MAAQCGLTLAAALDQSWEQLNALAAAHQKQEARQMLRFAQLLIAGQCDSKSWVEKQKQLIAEIKQNG